MKGAKVGKNCTIGEGVHIGPCVVIGDNVKIQNHSLIYEGVTIEDDVFLGPCTVTTNDIHPSAKGDWRDRFRTTLFKKGCSVGANSTIMCGTIIGENSLIGAGSVVIKSVEPNIIVAGNPAKFLRKNEK
jgi:UDP-2-acetamido-3-amino-2,3-dideoxy-glucuronate N-acetyltransferase